MDSFQFGFVFFGILLSQGRPTDFLCLVSCDIRQKRLAASDTVPVPDISWAYLTESGGAKYYGPEVTENWSFEFVEGMEERQYGMGEEGGENYDAVYFPVDTESVSKGAMFSDDICIIAPSTCGAFTFSLLLNIEEYRPGDPGDLPANLPVGIFNIARFGTNTGHSTTGLSVYVNHDRTELIAAVAEADGDPDTEDIGKVQTIGFNIKSFEKKWGMLTFTWDGSGLKGFVNGIFAENATTTEKNNTKVITNTIGWAYLGNGDFSHKFQLANMQLYKRILTTEEIEKLADTVGFNNKLPAVDVDYFAVFSNALSYFLEHKPVYGENPFKGCASDLFDD